MERFIFKFGQEEYACKATSSFEAIIKARMFIDKMRPVEAEYGWVPSSEGPNIFRMSIGD